LTGLETSKKNKIISILLRAENLDNNGVEGIGIQVDEYFGLVDPVELVKPIHAEGECMQDVIISRYVRVEIEYFDIHI